MPKCPDIEAALAELFQRRAGVIKPGLVRMQRALDHLGELNEVAPCTVIGGTNGKGSTAGMLWHMLALAGLKVGLFTSPHICHFRERIQISTGDVSDDELLGALDYLRQQIPPDLFSDLSFFEVTTLLAALIFRRKDCDWIIYEVGLGGRLDATNVFSPASTAIVSIDYDHQQWLGNSLEEILGEKLGICRPQVPLFWGQDCSGEDKAQLGQLVLLESQRQNLPLFQVGHAFFLDDQGMVRIDLGQDCSFVSPLPAVLASRAPVLQRNFALATAMFADILRKRLPGREVIKWLNDVIARFGNGEVPWPTSLIARFQSLQVREEATNLHQDLIVDVCHNVDSVRQLIHSLQIRQASSVPLPWPGIVSISKDKAIPEMIRLLRGVLHPLVLFKMNNERALSRDDLGEENRDLVIFEDFSSAWKHCWADWRELSDVRPWIVCGSFFTVGEVFNYFDVFAKSQEKHGILNGSFGR